MVGRIKFGQFPFRLLFDFRTYPAKFICQFRPVSGNVLQHDLEDQASDGVKIARKGFTSQSQRLQRNRSAPSKGIDDQGRFLWVRSPDQCAARFQIVRISGVIPVREIGDE
ncbi:MAG: hypothetical protein JW884_11830 [Deltaproteobacteria bacterium]|nr:hypothetical protein [Deltaproteobacteria bacterium]